MEGASGIFDRNRAWAWNVHADWRNFGRDCITNDVLAVCVAAADFGIEDIMLYDGHFAGNPEFNVKLEILPKNVRVFDVPDRCFDWRRIRGQAAQRPFGLITVGQHARFGTPDAYAAHTISPQIKAFWLNGLHIAEIGCAVLSFNETPYLANIGCKASMKEALELSPDIQQIAVKDKAAGWEPSPEESFGLICGGVTAALRNAESARCVELEPPYEFAIDANDGYFFNTGGTWPWKGIITRKRAEWLAPSVEIGLELFNYVRDRMESE
jgi:D-aminopeptidase